MLLPRESLPLSILDLSAPSGEFPSGPGRFFESHIRILDLDGRLRQAPSVLLARSEHTQNVYAIERYQLGLYVVCKLGSWVSIEKLSKLAEACYAPRCIAVQKSSAASGEAALTSHQFQKENKRKRQAIEELQSMVRKRQKSLAPESQEEPSQSPVQSQITDQVVPSGPPALQAQAPQPSLLDPSADAQTSAQDIFQNIRSQYFEALYHSKGSLAYFAKSTLSKARAAFHFDCDANLDMKDLLVFLKSIVVAVPQIDKKYKETVPRLIQEMKLLTESSEENSRKSKRKRSTKLKLGKDGMWTGEIEQVKKWWTANKPDVRDDDDAPSNPKEIKYHISCLRTRETQLQMIILLEVLALEAMGLAQDTPDTQLPGLPAEDHPKETVEIPHKKKDKHDYHALLNLHADRMSIWQTTLLEEMKMIAAEAQAKSGHQLQKSDRPDSDPSKDFCIDIIVPFFAGRLPELSADLNRKLGGPVAASPPKTKKPADQSMRAPGRPATGVKKPSAQRAPKSLVRVLEDDSQKWKASRTKPGDVLARMRSATPAAIPGVKREGSEPLVLDRIPRGEQSLKERSRNVLSRSMSTLSNTDLKARKKEEEAKQIQEAISGIRKPNRHLIGRSIIEDAEKRTGSSSSPHPKKQRKPVRNAAAAAASTVQVRATPANYRFKDAVSGDSRSYSSFNFLPLKTDIETLPSSNSVIPSTAPRKSFRDDLRDDLAAFHIASTPNKVLESPAAPSRDTTRLAANHNSIPESSPIMARRNAPTPRDYLTTPGAAGDIGPSSPVLPRIFETPIKQRIATLPSTFENQNISSTPPEPRPEVIFATPAKKTAPVSVPTSVPQPIGDTSNSTSTLYQQMGWEDDFDALF
ncbi:hypothetical protein N0V93_003611 [Gnomoniopsis smithogilvyi]|uniref:DNA replication regulator Sld3 C-terminal domain-containing protein n=1 Tax=Gnomoniopsis smithogilvyi TaxID=1191159 RepID=A0A9W9D099_9PEZI|nr:hypothetical protein N0V93_003611 [Gnomoniopsis smithogilvyi]